MYEKNITGSGVGNFRNGGYRVNRDIVGDSGGEEDPLQNPRPPERVKTSLGPGHKHQEASGPASGLMMRAKRLSCRLSERASVLWRTSGASDDQPPPPVPRHRTQAEKYDTVISDNNHRRLLDRRTSRAYTCRELLCVVFIPCLLICVLGIVCSALVIHHVLGKEYESEISTLSSELASARDQSGVFMSTQKYQALMDQMNRQKIAIDREKEAVAELNSLVKKKGHEAIEANRKVDDMVETLDCTWSVVQKSAGAGLGGGAVLLSELDRECSLGSKAHLLLAVNDEASGTERRTDRPPASNQPRHRHSHHVSNNDRQHWLLGSNSQISSESSEFQQFLATEFTRMEQSIIDFANQQELFCNDFRRSLEAEVDKRHQDLSGLSANLGKMLENQLQTVGKLSNLATDQLYAEQKWVTGYLKTARNEADKESTTMQKFLTESVLQLLQQVDTSLQDQAKTMDSLQQAINTVFSSLVSDRQEFVNSQRKMMLTASTKVKAFSQLQGQELDAIAEREEKLKRSELQFGERFKEAKKKIDGLLSSLFSEYESYSGLVNKTSDANDRNLAAASARNEQMASLMDTAVTQAIDDGKSYAFKAENKEKLVRMELADKISDGQMATKSVNKRLDQVEAQTKQFIGERQGAWELHYNNQEIQLRKKADTNKELLQKHQSESQDLHSQMRTTSNSLESLLENHRHSDNRKTGERQSDLQSQCKMFSSFSELLSSELHARDSDIANYLFSVAANGQTNVKR